MKSRFEQNTNKRRSSNSSDSNNEIQELETNSKDSPKTLKKIKQADGSSKGELENAFYKLEEKIAKEKEKAQKIETYTNTLEVTHQENINSERESIKKLVEEKYDCQRIEEEAKKKLATIFVSDENYHQHIAYQSQVHRNKEFWNNEIKKKMKGTSTTKDKLTEQVDEHLEYIKNIQERIKLKILNIPEQDNICETNKKAIEEFKENADLIDSFFSEKKKSLDNDINKKRLEYQRSIHQQKERELTELGKLGHWESHKKDLSDFEILNYYKNQHEIRKRSLKPQINEWKSENSKRLAEMEEAFNTCKEPLTRSGDALLEHINTLAGANEFLPGTLRQNPLLTKKNELNSIFTKQLENINRRINGLLKGEGVDLDKINEDILKSHQKTLENTSQWPEYQEAYVNAYKRVQSYSKDFLEFLKPLTEINEKIQDPQRNYQKLDTALKDGKDQISIEEETDHTVIELSHQSIIDQLNNEYQKNFQNIDNNLFSPDFSSVQSRIDNYRNLIQELNNDYFSDPKKEVETALTNLKKFKEANDPSLKEMITVGNVEISVYKTLSGFQNGSLRGSELYKALDNIKDKSTELEKAIKDRGDKRSSPS